MTDNYHATWRAIRVRYLAIALLMPFFYLPGANFVYTSLGPDAPPYAFDLAIILYLQAIWCIAAYVTATLPVEIPFRQVTGGKPGKREIQRGLVLSIWLLIVSIGATYILFLPLSYWIPTFVTFWLIEIPDLVYYYDNSYPVFPNLLSLVSICAIAPVLEEFVFRGLILHRWAYKYGLKSAVVGSSLVFAVLHPDPLGAFVFGVGMCVLYLRSQSIFVPIICHGIYNLVVWSIEVGYLLVLGPEYEYTLEIFQNEWPLGAVSIIVASAWAVFYLRSSSGHVTWRLPAA